MASKPVAALRIKGETSDITLPIESILRLVNFDGTPDEVELVVANSQGELSATAFLDGGDYPGIYLNGYDAQGNPLYLANAELPNVSVPNAIMTRLYAGYAGAETDEPIALVQHAIDKPPVSSPSRNPTKIVYVDTRIAQYRPWPNRMGMPEHAEDEA